MAREYETLHFVMSVAERSTGGWVLLASKSGWRSIFIYIEKDKDNVLSGIGFIALCSIMISL